MGFQTNAPDPVCALTFKQLMRAAMIMLILRVNYSFVLDQVCLVEDEFSLICICLDKLARLTVIWIRE